MGRTDVEERWTAGRTAAGQRGGEEEMEGERSYHEWSGQSCGVEIDGDDFRQPRGCAMPSASRRMASDLPDEAAAPGDVLSSRAGARRRRRAPTAGLSGSGMQRALLAALVLAFLSGGVRAAINPQFFWKAQELHSCAVPEPASPSTCKCFIYDANNQVQPCISVKPSIADADFTTSPPDVEKALLRACTHDPKTPYTCMNPQDLGDLGCVCGTGNGCLEFATGWGDLTSNNKARCLTVIASLEDAWSLMGVYLKHVVGDGVPPQTPSDNTFSDARLRVTYRARYGQFEIYDQNMFCVFAGTGVQRCVVDTQAMQGITKPTSAELIPERLEFEKDINTGTFQMLIEGTFRQVYEGMLKTFYRAGTHQNTNRLRNRIYSPGPSRDFPYEEIVVTIDVAPVTTVGTTQTVGSFSQHVNHTHMMHIVDINDKPSIAHPKDDYQLPIQCRAGGSLHPDCHFGQFFSYEDTDPRVQIGGVEIQDTDAYEACTFLQQECNKIDVSVRAFKGAMGLNTRSRLSFYENTRSGQGFTAFISASNAAVKVLFYAVELTELLGPTGGSTVRHYNTQHSAQREYVTVTVSDQGFTGAAGIAQVNSIEIALQIVAVNDAPKLKSQVLEFSKFEDISSVLEGLTLSDVDVDEQIDSSLSRATWMKGPTKQQTLNKIQIKAEVIHGKLRLGYTRNLNLLQTADYYFFTIQTFRFGHDTCRVRDIIEDGAQITAHGEVDGVFGGVVYPGYKQACGLANIGVAGQCVTGSEAQCQCFIDNFCAQDGTMTLYVDNTRGAQNGATVLGYVAALSNLVSDQDKTCGGLPVYAAPNNFTHGLKCEEDGDCVKEVLSACTLGVNCTCCANATFVCSSHADCSGFDMGSMCGCMLGGPGEGECGPFFTDQARTTGQTTDLIQVGVDRPRLYGRQCTYRAPFPNSVLPGATEPEIRECLGAAIGLAGSTRQKLLDFVTVASAGTKKLGVVGNKVDIDRMLQNTNYITDLNYNRRYRPPVEERDPLTFNLEADNLDRVDIEAQDLGNSGGTTYDNKVVNIQVPIRVVAINNKPVANGPEAVTVTEDNPYHFIQAKNAAGEPTGPTTGLFVSDPDYKDFGFSDMVFTVNLTCWHGRLYLNETFLLGKGISGVRVRYRAWSNTQETRGLHYSKGTRESPRFGNGCQQLLQCTDTNTDMSTDSPYGFFESLMYGIVYSPLEAGGEGIGCGLCPEDTGNSFLSIEGTFADVNAALSLVTYLPDPNFNTRTGKEEWLIFQVNDNGAIGNDAAAPALTDVKRIPLLVESVNDRPIIGRRVRGTRIKRTYDDGNTLDRVITDDKILSLDNKMDSLCQSIPPAGDEYTEKCGALVRTHIDIDEDTVFIVTPDVLWIHDVDSQEAESMPPDNRRHCCGPAGETGCVCGQPCLCIGLICECDIPEVCTSLTDNGIASSVPIPGQLLVHLEVGKGKGFLSLWPPAGRVLFQDTALTFLTNATDTAVKDGGAFKPCLPQRSCMQNVTSITIRTTLGNLQTALKQMFLTYSGQDDFYGQDRLSVWVQDQGFTDECYATRLMTAGAISIRVVAVNDSPVILFPNEVLLYQKGTQCFVDFGMHANLEGLSKFCEGNQNASMIPPIKPSDPLKQPISISDVDLAATDFGNLTLLLKLGSDADKHLFAGKFFISQINIGSKNWYEEFRDPNGFVTMALMGNIGDMNKLLQMIRYDADPTYQGYVPLYISANDMLNFGECSGKHTCGQAEPCADHRSAQPHKEPQAAISTVLLDVTVGAKELCAATRCNLCNAEEGCGWCPGLCNSGNEGGKCMIGSLDKPRFENCPSAERTGLTYRQCEAGAGNIVAVAGGVGGAALLLLILTAIFLTWVTRRHGAVLIYAKKKRADFVRAGNKAQILPPADANYSQFFCLLVLVGGIVVVILMTSGSSSPACNFTETYFLDKASRIHLSLDNCQVRFLPTRVQPAPDNALQAVKIKIAYDSAPGVTLESSTCGVNATFSITNNRDDAVKYIGYYCYLEILVPDRFVMPQTTIVATGQNVTTVRAGPMDADAPDFGIDFGPNSFDISGVYVDARLENVSAKVFNFNVVHGGLIAVDLLSPNAKFTSTDADMIVTTKTETHVEFWQKSDTLVCLTAAKGSLYVNDACRRICKFQDEGRRFMHHGQQHQDLMDADPMSMEEEHDFDMADVADPPPGSRAARPPSTRAAPPSSQSSRRVDPWQCEGVPSVVAGKFIVNCSKYDPVKAAEDDQCPVGAPYLQKSKVPNIIGCTDLATCILTESPQCLCKPACDMANLNPPGECNDFGQCCQTICAGYSRADMFPREDMPRCGTAVDSILYPWCDGQGMRQQWNFTSELGQMSLQVMDASLNTKTKTIAAVHSYKGAAPVSSVEAVLDLLAEDKVTLDEQFHPGGGNQPTQQWFSLRLRGPGTPEGSVGEFVFVESIRYLIIQPWMFSVLSQGLLSPAKGAVTMRLNPAFCPSYSDPNSQLFQDRLVAMRALLIKNMENPPNALSTKAIPANAVLSFVSVNATEPRVFKNDPATNQIGVNLVKQSDYPLVMAILFLSLGLPIVTSLLLVSMCVSAGRRRLSEFRDQQLAQNQMTENLATIIAVANKDPDGDGEFFVPEKIWEMIGRTNFFYMFEDFIGDAEAQRTAFAQWTMVAVEVIVIALPNAVILVIAASIKTAWQASRCEFRSDKCNCLSETDFIMQIPNILTYIVYANFAVEVAELSLYYLAIPYKALRRVVRHLFYTVLFEGVFLGLVFLFVVVLFVLLGVLINPIQVSPYAIALVGTTACCASLFAKLSKFQTRVRRAVAKRVEVEKRKLKAVPPVLLDSMIRKNVEQAMHDNGLSTPAICITVFVFGLFLALVYIFLFVGFSAFTDSSSVVAGVINSGIAAALAIGAQQAVAKDGEEEDIKDDVDMMQAKVMRSVTKVMEMVAKQIDLAMRLFMRMKQGMTQESSEGETVTEDVQTAAAH